jgi:sodium/bile acid cotransporter 7
MASVLFGPEASLAVLPLMMFHQMQLMVCAVIAKRRAHDPVEPAVTEQRDEAIRSAAGTGTRSA